MPAPFAGAPSNKSFQVSIILPQRWNRGKMLYAIIRYGTLAFIALQLSSESRIAQGRLLQPD